MVMCTKTQTAKYHVTDNADGRESRDQPFPAWRRVFGSLNVSLTFLLRQTGNDSLRNQMATPDAKKVGRVIHGIRETTLSNGSSAEKGPHQNI